MPTLQKMYTLTVTPAQFLAACSVSELHEVVMLLTSNRYQAKMNSVAQEEEVPETPKNSPSLPGSSYPERYGHE